ncbi:hypothetical protein D1006_32240 [Burkholderia stabilis]|uniref:Uncharacterized protein n=1 Tax=Burkholderia stabilis TaxID=95485 RepID=A0A4Q2AKJ1_9BURK|nr:hypothetical protein D1006_32240 [Burkholderia stabilis]
MGARSVPSKLFRYFSSRNYRTWHTRHDRNPTLPTVDIIKYANLIEIENIFQIHLGIERILQQEIAVKNDLEILNKFDGSFRLGYHLCHLFSALWGNRLVFR